MINNKYFAIDAHCHIFPDKIAVIATKHTDDFYGLNSDYDGKLSTLLSTSKESGIDRYIVQSVATTPMQVRKINEFIANSVASNPDKLIGMGTMHPASEDLEGDIEHIISLGLHGVKLHPDIQDFKVDDSRCLKIYELCAKNKLPILMHTGDKRYDNSNPNRVLPILKSYPELTLVGAHFGGYSVWEEAAEKLSGMSNFYVDTCSSLFALSKEQTMEIIKKYGTDKVLFGTDYPMWNAKNEIDYLLDLNLSDSDYEKIFALNAMSVYGICKP